MAALQPGDELRNAPRHLITRQNPELPEPGGKESESPHPELPEPIGRQLGNPNNPQAPELPGWGTRRPRASASPRDSTDGENRAAPGTRTPNPTGWFTPKAD